MENTIEQTCQAVYRDLRCGLFHIRLLRPRILLTTGTPLTCVFDSGEWNVLSILIDPSLLVQRVKRHLVQYAASLQQPESIHRDNFERLWDARFLANR